MKKNLLHHDINELINEKYFINLVNFFFLFFYKHNGNIYVKNEQKIKKHVNKY